MLTSSLTSAATQLATMLRLSGKMGKTVRLYFRCDGGLERRERTTLRHPVSSVPYLSQAVLRAFARLTIPAPVLSYTVTLTDLIPFSGQQLELFADPPKPKERLHGAIATILCHPDAPSMFWVSPVAPDAYRLDKRYEWEQITAV
jgi:hypothetical protein